MSRMYLTEHGGICASGFTLRTNEFEIEGHFPCAICGSEVALDGYQFGLYLLYESREAKESGPQPVCDQCGEQYTPELQALRSFARRFEPRTFLQRFMAVPKTPCHLCVHLEGTIHGDDNHCAAPLPEDCIDGGDWEAKVRARKLGGDASGREDCDSFKAREPAAVPAAGEEAS